MENRELQEELIRTLHRFGRLNTGQVMELEGLTQGEFFSLGMLRKHMEDHPEGVYVWELARYMRVSPPGASRMLGGMERKGLIERSVDRSDRRNTYILVTPAGHAAWERTAKRVELFMNRVVGRMGAEDLRTLVGLWNRLSDVIEDEQKKESMQC